MRVLYVNEALRRFGPGPAVHGWSLVREFENLGAEVEVFPSARPSVAERRAPSESVRSVLASIRDQIPEEMAKLLSGAIRTVRRVLASRTFRSQPPDVVLGRHIAYDWTPWLAARLLRIPLVLEVNAPLAIEKQLTGVRPPAILSWSERVQWHAADRIYSVSAELTDVIASAGIARDRIRTIPNGASVTDVPTDRGGRTGPARILFVGGFYPWHGVEHLVEAVALISDAIELKVVLIGTGPSMGSVRALIAEHGLEARFELHGRLPHEEVANHLAEADIAVAPYPLLDIFYFSPLKLFEYMGAGLPVIASRQGQLAEVIEHGVTGLLYDPGDIQALARCIQCLAESREQRKDIGDAAAARIMDRHTWMHVAEEVLSLCSMAAGRHTFEPAVREATT